MRTLILVEVLGVAAIACAAACSATPAPSTFTGSGGDSSSSGSKSSGASKGSNATSGAGLGAGGFGFGGGLGSAGGGGPSSCNSTANQDKDGDGWTVAQGDCNDCDPNVNPGAVDVPPDPTVDGGLKMIDSDCNGKYDPPVPCDTGLAVDDADPFNGAKAIELCKKQPAPVSGQPQKWGVKSAKWVMPDGSPANPSPNYALGHGMLSGFGPNVKVQAGARMLGLSSGTARAPTDPGYMSVGGFDKGFTSGSPAGFPKESPACPGVITGEPHDGVALELVIQTPSNAHGFSFNFDFFTYEWPGYICSTYNDFFVALVMPYPKGQSDGNISFDSKGNPVSVNNALVDVCGCVGGPPCQAGGKNFPCSLGDKGLLGTGFGNDGMFGEDHGSTYWLQTTTPVAPASEITLRLTTYDSGDGILDTTALVDNWQWLADPGTTTSVTKGVPTPK